MAYLAAELEKIERAYFQLKVADKQIKRTLQGDGISELTDEVKATMASLGFEEKKYHKRHRIISSRPINQNSGYGNVVRGQV
ncbi:hypothetical protein ACFL1Z_04120 [Thermodesulfobacteriota bacterium]